MFRPFMREHLWGDQTLNNLLSKKIQKVRTNFRDNVNCEIENIAKSKLD